MEVYRLPDESVAWNEIQDIRDSFNPKVLEGIRASSRGEAIERGVDIVQKTLNVFENQGYKFLSPGHSYGHIARDYMNALILLNEIQEVDSKHILPAFVGGALHDIGNAIIPRFEEHKRAVRHAEAGALFINHLFDKNQDLNDAERLSIAYSIAAHTHYTKESTIICSDNEVRVVKPYIDLDEKGMPILPVWITRWVDRLDCIGPTSVGRHYLTLEEEHKDFDGKVHFDVKFEHHMLPLLRDRSPEDRQRNKKGETNQTMREHLKMFADTQNNNSSYGKHDFGLMIKLRDRAVERTHRIVQSTQTNLTFSNEREMEIRNAWKSFLGKNIEPTELGRKTAETIDKIFGNLEEHVRDAWCNGFLMTMQEYTGYAHEKLRMLEGVKGRYYVFPVIKDIRNFLNPKQSWIVPFLRHKGEAP